MRSLGLCLLICAAKPGLAATRLAVEQLRELVVSARTAGASDQDIADKLAGIELKERFSPSNFPEDLGPRTKDALRILAAESAFLSPPAAAVPGDPRLAPDKQQALLAKAHEYTLNYIHNLPDFVCTRTTHRFDDSRSSQLKARDVTSSELTYNRGQESDAPHIVDRPTCGSVPEGLTSYGEFGSIVAALFTDGGDATLVWSHWEILNGRRAAVFTYSVDNAHSHYKVTWCCWTRARMKYPDHVTTAYKGELSLDPDTGAILRLTRRALPPASFPNYRTDTMVEYQPVDVGDKSYTCPARSVTVAVSRSPDGTSTILHYVNEMLFTSYHKFLATAALHFGDSYPAASVASVAPVQPGTLTARKREPAEDCSEEAAPTLPRKTPPAAPPSAAAIPVRRSYNTHYRVLRFSPDGQYVLAQDNAGVVVLNVQPFRVRFRAPAENASDADFTPDSREFLFIGSVTHADQQHLAFASHAAHVERWNIADRRRTGSTEMSLQTCDTIGLSPDGRVAVCVDFAGTLRLLDVSTGQLIYEKQKFGKQYVSGDVRTNVYGDPGAARIEFSPDGRFVIVSPTSVEGSTVAWDLRERRALTLAGPLRNLHGPGFTFVAPDRILVSRLGSGGLHRFSTLLAFPSGELLLKPAVPRGMLARAADPAFVLVRTLEPPSFRAFELNTGQIIENETSALDVFGGRYVAERADGELELYEKGHGQSPGDPIQLGKIGRGDAIVQTSGQVVRMDDKQFVVRTDDRREVTLLISDGTKFFDGPDAIAAREIRPGEFVDVESTETDDEEFQAMKVERRPAPQRHADEALKPSAPNEPETPHPTFLQEARHIAAELSGSLPDYTCVERVTRYRSENHASTLWKVQDVVSAEIVHKAGQDDRPRPTLNGKPTNPERMGNRTWSSGDFRAVLTDVLAPSSAARVAYQGEARLGEFAAVMYSFHIDAEQSRWLVQEGGQSIRPARDGTIWFDRATKRLLRIEFQGVDIPPDFPTETVELAIDYDLVQLGAEEYLVPTHADQLGCRRRMAFCTKNSVEFRDYQRLAGEPDGPRTTPAPAPPAENR